MITTRQKRQLNAVCCGLGNIIEDLQSGTELQLEGSDLTNNTGNVLLDNCEAANMDVIDTPTVWSGEVSNAWKMKGTYSFKLSSLTTDNIGTHKVSNTIASENWTNTDTIGFWAYSDIALAAGKLQVAIKSTSAGWQYANVPALVAGVPKFCEVDISLLTKTDVVGYGFKRNKVAIFNVWIDQIYKLNSTMRISLTNTPITDTVQILAVLKAETGANTFTAISRDTDFVECPTGKHIYFLTDQSSKTGIIAYAY